MKRFFEAKVIGYESEDVPQIYIIETPGGKQHVSISIRDMTQGLSRSIVDRVLDGPAPTPVPLDEELVLNDFLMDVAIYLGAKEEDDTEALEAAFRALRRTKDGLRQRPVTPA